MTDLLPDRQRTPVNATAAQLFAGDGELRALCRAHAWASTSLGPVDDWGPGLRAAARLVLSAPVPMSLYVGPEFITLYNDAFCSVLGAKHPRALGRPASEVWAEIWDQIEPLYRDVYETGSGTDQRNVPFAIVRSAGGNPESAWFDYALSPVRDEGTGDTEGSVVAILSVVSETTMRITAEAALKRERARLTEVFRDTPSFLAVLRGDDNVFDLVNPAYEQIIGHGRDVVGKPLFDALPETRGQGFDAYIAQVRRTGAPLVFRDLPVMLEREKGAPLEERFIDITYLPLVEADGSHDAVIAHGTDVTEQVRARREVERLLAESEVARTAMADAARRLEESEAAARRTLDELEATYRTSPIGMAVVDRALRFQRINERLAEINGVCVADHLGRTVREILPELADVVEPRLQHVLDTGVAEYAIAVDGETPAAPGVLRHWMEHWLPLRDRDGTIVGINIVAEEVTDQHHAAAERERLLEETLAAHAKAEQARLAAEAANQAKATFLTMMSHELRTPLNAIGGYTELIELGIRGPVTAEQLADLARIQQSQRHLLSLINGVLNFARLDAGTVDFTAEEVSMHEVLGTCESLILPQLRSKSLSLESQCSTAVPTVRADREKTQQVLLNLLSNALKFTAPGGRIVMGCDVAADGSVATHVTDTGCGIAAEQLDRIFEPFVQVDVALTRAGEGTGLGLAISRDLARGMGGELTVISTLGAGSTFTLRLPPFHPASK